MTTPPPPTHRSVRWRLTGVFIILGLALGLALWFSRDEPAPSAANDAPPHGAAAPQTATPHAPRTPARSASGRAGADRLPAPRAPATMAQVGDPLSAAHVDGAPLLTGALDRELRRVIDRARRDARPIDWPWLERQRALHLERMIDDALIDAHLQSLDLRIPRAQLDAALADEITRRYGSREGFDRFLARTNTTQDDVLDRLRHRLALEHVLARVGRIEPSDQELETVYQRNQRHLRSDPRARLTMLLVPLAPRADEAAVSAAEQRARRLHDLMAAAPLDVDALNARAAELGAQLLHADQPLTRSQLPPIVARAVFSAPPGAQLEPVRSSRGIHIIHLFEKHDEPILTLDEVRDSIARRARRDLIDQRRRQLIDQLRADADVARLDSMWHRRLQRRLRFVHDGAP